MIPYLLHALKKQTIALVALALFVLTTTAFSQSDLTQKLMMGYQGWFLCKGDNSAPNEWRHWFQSTTTPSVENLNIDLWPDMSEYTQKYNTNMTYANGTNAQLFSSHDLSTTQVHFRWMKENNIHGVYLQRFLGEAVNDARFFQVRNHVLENVMTASATHGRKFSIMYDISGVADDGNLYNKLINDWQYLVDTYNMLTKAEYAKQDGLPVIAIWGIGFSGRGLNPATFEQIINYFHNSAPAKYRAYIVGGVPGEWRTLSGDSESDSRWLGIYRSLDMISPWSVGRYGDNTGANNWMSQRIVPDLADCNSNGVDYMPVIWPGFSWYNMHDGGTPLNQIPRNGGNFYWRQAYNAISAGSKFVYVAMFDEVDEATAMFKVAATSANQPAQASLVPLNADGVSLPSDWYLRLANETQKMLDKSIPLTSTIPITPTTIAVTGVGISPTSASISVGSTQQLIATISPANASNKTVFFTTSNSAIASVNATGLVTANASGVANITVTTQDGSKTAVSAITVTPVSQTPIAANPFITQLYTADPSAHVWADGRLYVYASHDIAPPRGCDLMDQYHVFSTADMLNWTDHGEILRASQVPWGRPEGGFMWAPDCAYKNGTYYFYFPHPSGTDWGATWKIGIATSTSPASGFVVQGYIPGLESMIDPCVYIDDDGQAYFYYGGGGVCKGGKMKSNMMEIDGAMQNMTGLDDFHEAAWVHKRNGVYYLSYADNHDVGDSHNQLRYATSTNPLGPWTSRGIYMDPTDSYTNHGSIVEYKGQSYAFYHNSSLSNNDWLRSICADKLFYNADGTIQKVIQTKTTKPRSPFGGNPWAIPGVIEAENFDNGGEGVAYHDNDATNNGGQGRTTEGVDVEICSEGGTNVGWTNTGEWFEFTVNVALTGTYTLDARVASVVGSSIHVEFGGVNKTGTLTVPATGGWQTWQTVSKTGISLNAGSQIMRVYMEAGEFNINKITLTTSSVVQVTGVTVSPTTFSLGIGATQQITATVLPANATNKTVTWTSSNTAVATVSSTGLVTALASGTAGITVTTLDGGKTAIATITTTGPVQGPVGGIAWPIPGTIEAENYDTGGETVAYHDNDVVNSGGQGRTTEGVDLENCGEGTLNIGWTNAGEWLEYTVNVSSTGTYSLDARVASPSGSSFRVEFNGVDKTGTLTAPATGGWQTWQSVTKTGISLSAGVQIMRVYLIGGNFNLNKISFSGSSVIPVTSVSVSPASTSLVVGAGQQLTATVLPTNATNKAVTWTSSNSAVANVNASGLVSGLSTGSATITVRTSDGGFTATSAITVTTGNVPVTGVSVSPTSASIAAGTTRQLTSTVLPANATNKAVTWTSSNTSAATVNASGLVTGLSVGTSTITVRTNNGGFTTTCAVTVTPVSTLTYYRIKNRWQNTYLTDGGDRVAYSAIPASPGLIYEWIREDVGNGQFELKNASTGEYMHIENLTGSIQCTARTSGWMSSRWSTESTDNGFVRIKNVWQPAQFIHVENLTGFAQHGTINAAWMSAQWIFEAVAKSATEEMASEPNAQVSYMPNPVMDELNIQFNGNSFSKVSVYDFTGKMVRTASIPSESTEFILDMSELNNGLFIIRLDNNSDSQVFRIIKQ